MGVHNSLIFNLFSEMEVQERIDSEDESATEEERTEELDNRVLNGFQGSLTETGDVLGSDSSSTAASATASHSARLPRRQLEALLILLLLMVLL